MSHPNLRFQVDSRLATLLSQEYSSSERALKELVDNAWRRLVFNFLICNTDDHLRNTGFLYDARQRGWRLSPAFDLNPMPGNRRESKTRLTEDTGVIDSQDMLMAAAQYFRLAATQADAIWGEVAQAVAGWRAVARDLGMRGTDLLDFEPAFVESTTP